MLRIVINGILGKMGQVLCSKLSRTEGLYIVGGIDTLETFYGDEIVVTTNPFELLSDTDVVLDFSSPAGTEIITTACRSAGIPLISGTRNLTAFHRESILQLSEDVPVLHSGNFSIGLNIILSMLEQLPEQIASPYDADIMDIAGKRHHVAPSDSAREIQNILIDSSNPPSNKQAMIHSIRNGNLCPEHQLQISFGCETISIQHRSMSYRATVDGVLAALNWLPQQAAGLYSMRDLLSDKKKFSISH